MINFKGFSEQKRFDCLAFGKDGIAFTACSLNRTLEKIQITSDSVGICATVIKKITYEDSSCLTRKSGVTCRFYEHGYYISY